MDDVVYLQIVLLIHPVFVQLVLHLGDPLPKAGLKYGFLLIGLFDDRPFGNDLFLNRISVLLMIMFVECKSVLLLESLLNLLLNLLFAYPLRLLSFSLHPD